MGYYKYYLRKLIKFILRWFDKKTLILIILFLLFLCWNEGVFALQKSVYELTDEEILQLTQEELENLSEEEYIYLLDRIEAITNDFSVSTYDFSSIDSTRLYEINTKLSNIQSYLWDIRSNIWNSESGLYAQTAYLRTISANISTILTRLNSINSSISDLNSGISDLNSSISEITKYFKQSESSSTTTDFVPSYNNNIGINISNSTFASVSDNPSNNEYWCTYYFPIQKDHTYKVQLVSSASYRRLRWGFCQSVPSVGSSASTLNTLDGQSSLNISFTSDGSYSYVYITVDSRLTTTTRVFKDILTTTTDNPLNIFDNQQKNHEEQLANSNQNTDKINNTLTSSEVSEDTYNIDTSFSSGVDDENYTNFLTNWINTIIGTFSSRASTNLEIPIPFVDETIVIHSDIVSKHIQGTLLYLLIQVFWYFKFGAYFFRFGSRAVHWLTSGELIERGPGAFAEYLMKQNAVITSDLM